MRKDGQLRAAEKSPVVLSVLRFLKSLMKTSSPQVELWLVSGIRGDELIQGFMKPSRSSHGEVGILAREAKGAFLLPFSSEAHSARLGRHYLSCTQPGKSAVRGIAAW